MNGNAIDLCGPIWEPSNTLGEHSLFVGDSYPIVRHMPPCVHDADDLSFMKHGCVFIAHHQIESLDGVQGRDAKKLPR